MVKVVIRNKTKKHVGYRTKANKVRRNREATIPINSLMPTGYTSHQRAKLREFEKRITTY